MVKGRYPYSLPTHKVDYGVIMQVTDLKVDPQAQRTLSEQRAQKIAAGLIPEAVGEITVSQRESGDKMIVDGMHRRRAFELNGIVEITAEVHYGLSLQEEAILFLIKNRESNKPNPYDEYRIGLTAGLPLFVDTEKVLVQHQLELGSSSANSIGAVAGVLRITENSGPDVLDRTLSVCEAAWSRTAQTWDGVLLGGVSMFLDRHGELVSDKELANKLAKAGHAQQWVGAVHSQASGGGLHNSGTGSRISTCYQLIVKTWNKGKTKNRIVI